MTYVYFYASVSLPSVLQLYSLEALYYSFTRCTLSPIPSLLRLLVHLRLSLRLCSPHASQHQPLMQQKHLSPGPLGMNSWTPLSHTSTTRGPAFGASREPARHYDGCEMERRRNRQPVVCEKHAGLYLVSSCFTRQAMQAETLEATYNVCQRMCLFQRQKVVRL